MPYPNQPQPSAPRGDSGYPAPEQLPRDSEPSGGLDQTELMTRMLELRQINLQRKQQGLPPVPLDQYIEWKRQQLKQYSHGGLAKMKECNCHG